MEIGESHSICFDRKDLVETADFRAYVRNKFASVERRAGVKFGPFRLERRADHPSMYRVIADVIEIVEPEAA